MVLDIDPFYSPTPLPPPPTCDKHKYNSGDISCFTPEI